MVHLFAYPLSCLDSRLLENAFRRSFFYEPETSTLWLHAERLDNVGGFLLVLVHALAHIQVGDLDHDASPRFMAEFYRCMKVCSAELFFASARSCSPAGAAAMSRQLQAASIFEALFAEVPTQSDELAVVQQLVAGEADVLDETLLERLRLYGAAHASSLRAREPIVEEK